MDHIPQLLKSLGPALGQGYTTGPHPHPYIYDAVLHIFDLPPYVTDDHLATTFQYCAPFRLNILRDPINPPHLEQALSGTIEFESIDTAEKALATLQLRPIQGLYPPASLFLSLYPQTSPSKSLPLPASLPRLVGHLPVGFTGEELYDLFRPYGALSSVCMQTGFGSGVVEFWHEADADDAEEAMHLFPVELEGQRISITIYQQGLGNGPSVYDASSGPPLDIPSTTSTSRVVTPARFPTPLSGASGSDVGFVFIDPCNLLCKNLDPGIDENILFTHFGQFGQIVSIRVVRDASGKSRGFGFVRFKTAYEATAAVHRMDGLLLGSKNLVVEIHEPKRLRSRQAVSMPRVGNDASQNEPSILGDSHDVPVQKPRQPEDAMEMEGNILKWNNAKWLMGALNWGLEPEARLEDEQAKKSVGIEMNVHINDIFSRSPFDLTGQVTKSDHHPFAKGSYGDIYKGIYRLRDRLINVAIKTSRMYLQHDQELPKKMKRFRRELIIWQGLKHQNILPFLGTIIDPSTNPDIPAMVCPFAENGALTTYLCERDNELTVVKRLTLINDVAHGLQYLHSQQIVHGDLSGSNVLIDDEGKACITDFGLSTLLTRLGGSTFATTHQAKGTMRWMAPEVLDPDDSHDSKATPTMESDTYSFGSIMLQILTGKVPYHHLARDEQVVFAIVKGTKHVRPDTDTVTDHRWRFMEWCWSPAKSSTPRPSSDEIARFTGAELAAIDPKVTAFP